MVPIDAAVMPLPRDETTPPVTNTNLAMRGSSWRVGLSNGSTRPHRCSCRERSRRGVPLPATMPAMELTYIGLSCLRLRGRDADVVVDPLPPGVGRGPRLSPDIVVRTDGRTAPERLRARAGQPQEVSGPGEYELRGVSVYGVAAGEVTIMRVEVDDVRVAALGRLHRQLTEDEVDALGHVDVLAVPVGGGDALAATEATRLVNTIEPAIVVPVRYRVPGIAGDY